MKRLSVLFVCLGNICRSPAAEAIFLDLIDQKGLKNRFIVDSAGTGSWHVGKKADYRMREAAIQRNINIVSRARKIDETDFEKFNFIIAMDNSNFDNILKMKNRLNSTTDYAKILKIQDFSSEFQEKEVPDPYFGGEEGFQYVLDILSDSVSGFLKSIS